MKGLSKIATSLVAIFSFAIFAVTPMVSADGTGVIGGGDIYQIANLTQKTGYANPTTANACDELEYSVKLHNSGYTAVSNVNVSASLPSTQSTSNTSNVTITYTNGINPSTSASATVNISTAQTVSYENNSTVYYDGQGTAHNLNDGIIGSGVNIGSINGSTTEFVNFKAKINCQTPVTPVYTCDNLQITAESDRTVKVSNFAETAKNGAVFNNATIAWGDAKSDTFTNPVGQSHQYGADGTYTISAVANFTVDGKSVTATGTQCDKQVTFSTNKPPTVTPPTTPPVQPAAPTALVNTGPGSVLGLFAVTTAAGMFLYRKMVTRRLSRQ